MENSQFDWFPINSVVTKFLEFNLQNFRLHTAVAWQGKCAELCKFLIHTTYKYYIFTHFIHHCKWQTTPKHKQESPAFAREDSTLQLIQFLLQYWSSRSSKVEDFHIIWNGVCNFLLMIN